jgi:hypothetical protein
MLLDLRTDTMAELLQTAAVIMNGEGFTEYRSPLDFPP